MADNKPEHLFETGLTKWNRRVDRIHNPPIENMCEIIRHLRQIRRHVDWTIVRLQDEPSPSGKRLALKLATAANEELALVRALLEP